MRSSIKRAALAGMKVSLVGADYEENLAVGMLAASLLQAGHRVRVVPYFDDAPLDSIVRQALDGGPELVGFSIQFQQGAADLLELARRMLPRKSDRLSLLPLKGRMTGGRSTTASDSVPVKS